VSDGVRPCITVTITRTRGSTPRGAGTQMQIFAEGQSGTIGGGALEWEATRLARAMLADGRAALTRSFPLGPDLGQCCGGAVDLSFHLGEVAPKAAKAPKAALWVWGAGHVGRAVVQVMKDLPAFEITWVDTGADRFPDPMPPEPAQLVAADPTRVIQHAPADAAHLILTYSHDLDLRLCDGLLAHGFGFAGLIGSATKWARFRKRLAAAGFTDAQTSRISCPIGDPQLGKHPSAIAIGVAAQLIHWAACLETRPE